MLKNKTLGSILIVIGTAIGAGMLQLPIASAEMGFGWSFLLLIVIWAIAYLSALLILEVNLAFKGQFNNFNTMAKKTLGRGGEVTAWICACLLLYALASAYISGGASLLSITILHLTGIQPPILISALVFTLILGSFIFVSTRAVDGVNRFLFSAKGIILILVFAFTMPKIDFANFLREPGAQHYLWAAAPLFITSFGFHTVIPTLSEYMNYDTKRLKRILLLGSLIPLMIYTLWQAISFGLLPLTGVDSFNEIQTSDNSLGTFATSLNQLLAIPSISLLFNGFFYVALATSFLGVCLSLFDFLRTGFKRENTVKGRGQTALLTFIPPLVFAVFYPNGFGIALRYAAIFLCVLFFILPAMMAWRVRSNTALDQQVGGSSITTNGYQLIGGKPMLVFLFAAGTILIALQIAAFVSII